VRLNSIQYCNTYFTIGGYTALSTKGVASLLSYTLWRVITFPVFYLLVLILVGTAVMQIKYVNRALQHFDATQVIPVQFVLFTLSVILGSAVLYRDFERTSGDDAGKFVGGCAMTFLGVWFITTGRPRRQNDSEDHDPESEDAINLAAEPYRDETATSTRRSSTIHSSNHDSRPSTPAIKLIPDPVVIDILSNPWSSAPQISRHTSTPILPSEAAPPPTSMTAVSDPELVPPRTPTRGKSSTEIPTTPTTSTPTLRRLRTNERLIAGGTLLASPLSTTLSAMVQDAKRTGTNASVRRRGSAFGIEADGFGEPLGRRRTREEEGISEPPTMSRGRSFSASLGDLWKGLKGRGSQEFRDDEGREGR
jgi:hypothetical protein